jgi:hypothetical protein
MQFGQTDSELAMAKAFDLTKLGTRRNPGIVLRDVEIEGAALLTLSR